MRDRPFVVRRYDLDFVVLPVKYLEEIRLISYKKLSSRGAQVGVNSPRLAKYSPNTNCSCCPESGP
jgi:hypothetical protein